MSLKEKVQSYGDQSYLGELMSFAICIWVKHAFFSFLMHNLNELNRHVQCKYGNCACSKFSV